MAQTLWHVEATLLWLNLFFHMLYHFFFSFYTYIPTSLIDVIAIRHWSPASLTHSLLLIGPRL